MNAIHIMQIVTNVKIFQSEVSGNQRCLKGDVVKVRNKVTFLF